MKPEVLPVYISFKQFSEQGFYIWQMAETSIQDSFLYAVCIGNLKILVLIPYVIQAAQYS